MSVTQQAIAARRRARMDSRYKGLKTRDAATSRRRAEVKLRREQERKQRKSKR